MSNIDKTKNAIIRRAGTQFSSDEIELIKNTVAIGATENELKTFLYLSEEYNLDPLKKEIYFIKYGGKSTIITSRDGYLKIANLNKNFDGFESDVVYHGDKLTKREDGSLLIEYSESHLLFDKSKLSGAFCNVWRKDRNKSITVFVSIKDYYKKGAPIWEQYINAMILKVAESMALKRAFAISGLITREEIDKENFDETDFAEENMATEAQKKAIVAIINAKNVDEENLKQIILKNYNKNSAKELTKDQASSLISMLNSL